MMTDDELKQLLQRLEPTEAADDATLERIFGAVDAVRRSRWADRAYLGVPAAVGQLRPALRMTAQAAAALLILALLITLSAAALVGVFRPLLSPTMTTPDRAGIRPPTVAIEPTAVVPVDGRPGDLVSYYGFVWVAHGDAVSRIDPSTNRIVATTRVGSGRASVGAGPAGVWVASLDGGFVAPLDAKTGQLGATVAIEGPEHITVGEDDVWVSSPLTGEVSRIEASSGRIIRSFVIGASPTRITLLPEAVLVGHYPAGIDPRPGEDNGWLSIIDPRTGAFGDVSLERKLRSNIRHVLVAGDDLWFTATELSALLRVRFDDPLPARKPGRVDLVIPLGDNQGIEGAAVAQSRIFVTINPYGERSAVVVIDPVTGAIIESIGPADMAPDSTRGLTEITEAAGSLWVGADWPALHAVLRVDPVQ